MSVDNRNERYEWSGDSLEVFKQGDGKSIDLDELLNKPESKTPVDSDKNK